MKILGFEGTFASNHKLTYGGALREPTSIDLERAGASLQDLAKTDGSAIHLPYHGWYSAGVNRLFSPSEIRECHNDRFVYVFPWEALEMEPAVEKGLDQMPLVLGFLASVPKVVRQIISETLKEMGFPDFLVRHDPDFGDIGIVLFSSRKVFHVFKDKASTSMGNSLVDQFLSQGEVDKELVSICGALDYLNPELMAVQSTYSDIAFFEILIGIRDNRGVDTSDIRKRYHDAMINIETALAKRK